MAEPIREYRSYEQELEQPAQESPLRVLPPLDRSLPHRSALATLVLLRSQRILQIGFLVLMVAVSIDKFFNQLADWPQYLHPTAARAFVISRQTFLYLVGFWEFFLALGIAFRPKIFADLLAAWLCLIAVNLALQGKFYDIALRDFALAAGACALARLSQAREKLELGSNALTKRDQ